MHIFQNFIHFILPFLKLPYSDYYGIYLGLLEYVVNLLFLHFVFPYINPFLLHYFRLVKPTYYNAQLFRFSDFIATLAILLALFMMTETRYRVRVYITPFISLDKIAYLIFIFVGSSSLFFGYWDTKGLLIPEILSNALAIQLFLGILFTIPVFLWIWFAFIKPPHFSSLNSKRYYDYISKIILQGNSRDLSTIAIDVWISSKKFIEYARTFKNSNNKKKPKANEVAHRILLLLGYKRFCQQVVSSSPITAIALFSEVTKQKAYKLPINQFAANIFYEALINKDSILYHEDNLYESGLVGHYKLFSNSLFSDYNLIENLAKTGKSPFDIAYRKTWDSDQIDAFSSCFVIFFRAYLNYLTEEIKKSSKNFEQKKCDLKSFEKKQDTLLIETIIERNYSFAFSMGAKVLSYSYYEEIYQEHIINLDARVRCICEIIKTLNEKNIPYIKLRNFDEYKDFYDIIVSVMFDLIFEASCVKQDVWKCWQIQYSVVFNNFFSSIFKGNKIIHYRLRRAIYN